MKRLILSLLALALLATPVYGEFDGGGGGSSTVPGISSNIHGEYPHAGRLILWMDDGFRWSYDDVDKAGHFTSPENYNSLAQIFQAINVDSSLVGTPWEMQFVVGCNVYGSDADSVAGNGLQGYHGQVGNAVPDTTQSLFASEVPRLYGTGIVEIALHGANAMVMDPYALDSPDKVEGPFGTIGALFGTTQGMIVDGYKAMVDSVGVPIYSYMTNGHRIDHLGEYYMAQYFRNVRAGWINNSGSTEFPAANGSVGTSTTQRGTVLQFTRANYDLMEYALSGYSSRLQRAVLPFTNAVSRMWFPHSNPPNNGNAATNIAEWKMLCSELAETKSTMIVTIHDQNLNPPSTPTNTTVAVTTDNQGNSISPANGMEGLEIVLRAAAHYACNGLYNRDSQPRLLVTTMDKAMNARNSIGHLGGIINYIGNFKMEADTCSYMSAGDAAADKPWGYPSLFAFDSGDASNRDCWADSLWTYLPPATADDAGDNFFGYFNATGCFASAISNVQEFHALCTIVNVEPGSLARVSCYANASHLPDAGGPLDSLSAGLIDIKVIPFSHFDADRADTTTNWLNEIRQSMAYYKVSEDLDGPPLPTNTFNGMRVQGRWHSRDENANIRAAGYSSGPWYESGTANTDADMRWRPFWSEVEVPDDANFLYIEFIPSRQTSAVGVNPITVVPGFALAVAETLQIAGIEVQGVPR